MGLFDFLRKPPEEEPALDPLHDLVLDKLRVGYLVDYDLQTWTVTAYNRYVFDGAEVVEEWELTAGSERRYLERSEDDGVQWSLSRKLPVGALGGEVRRRILADEEPPARIEHDGHTYYLDASTPGVMRSGGDGPEQELIQWEYVDEREERFVTVEQWSETEVEAAVGESVEAYQFSNILVGDPAGARA